jgi:phage/plasmid-associated DNA primase
MHGNIPFDKYKERLKDLLRQYGVELSINPTRCFNQSGHKHGDANPSLQIFDNSFKCYGCGIQGDIYDAVEILEGITSRKEQFIFIEKFFNGVTSINPVPYKSVWGKDGDKFTPDSEAIKHIETYLKKYTSTNNMVKQFLDTRAFLSSGGVVSSYPQKVETYLLSTLYYWPGLDMVRHDIQDELLKKSGIPLVNPRTGYSTWGHSGVVIKLGTGYKLHYYEKRYCNKCKEAEHCKKYQTDSLCQKCQKMASRGGSTFPTPGKIDKTKPVIVVEGEMDALASTGFGIPNLFSAGGSKLLTGPKVKDYLLDVPEIIICFDDDDAGKAASGLIPYPSDSTRVSSIPDIIRKAGYTGKIKIAQLPPESETGCNDQDALVIAGKGNLICQAIADAKDYMPLPKQEGKKAEPNRSGSIWKAYDSISIERLKDLFTKIERKTLDAEDRQPFVSACMKACKHGDTRQELLKWGAPLEEIDAQNDISPYYLLEFCNKYGISKYLKSEIEKSLVPESEMLKVMREDFTQKININFEKLATRDSVKQFMATKGTHSAAEVVYDVLDGNIVYLKNENQFYFFNGHVWEYEPNMSGIVYSIICSIIRYFMAHNLEDKRKLWELIIKTEGRRFRVEVVQELLEFHAIHKVDTNFDSPLIKETLTLADGVIDFSGSEIIFRKSKREEFRRDFLPYSIDDVKNTNPKMFKGFMNSNFKNKETLRTIMYYLALIPSRNTQFKYGGIFIGKRHTGKTTAVELIRQVFRSGTGNDSMISSIPSDVLITQGRRRNNGNEATPYIAALEGKGAGVASETERGGLLNNSLFKLLTGGDTLIARGLYQNPRNFIPTAQIIVVTNHSPRFDAQDSATVDRMVIIPFSVEHNKEDGSAKMQSDIINSLRPEFPGIVRLLAEYYLNLRIEHNGAIPFSDECLNYKNNYVDEQRTDLDKFVNENIEFGLGGEYFEKAEDLYNRFLAYYDISEEEAKDSLSRKKFTFLLKRDFLEMKNFKKHRIGDKVLSCFFNIRLKPFDPTADMGVPSSIFDKEKSVFPSPRKNVQNEPEENPFYTE